MNIVPGSALVDFFEIQGVIGLILLAAVIVVVARAAVREIRSPRRTQKGANS